MARSKKKVEKPEVKTEPKVEKPLDWTPPPRDPKYRVAKGKAISCRKGIRSDGDPIEAINVGGQECLDGLVKSGHVEKY